MPHRAAPPLWFSLSVLCHLVLNVCEQQTHWLLLEAGISRQSTSLCRYTAAINSVHIIVITYDFHGMAVKRSMFSLHFCSSLLGMFDELYCVLTWNTCRCFNKLSIEVRNDCITFFSWLHPENIEDIQYNYISDNCRNKDCAGAFQNRLPFWEGGRGGSLWKIVSSKCTFCRLQSTCKPFTIVSPQTY